MAHEKSCSTSTSTLEHIGQPDAVPNAFARSSPSHLYDAASFEHDNSTPPAYSGPQNPTPQPSSRLVSTHFPTTPGIPSLPYNYYLPPSFTLSSDKTTITSSSAHLSNPGTLLPLLHSLCSLPPKPTIHIVGKCLTTGIVDFHLKLNLMSLIIGQGDRKMNYMKLIGKGEKGWRGNVKETTTPSADDLETWVNMYCKDGAAVKEFILTRHVVNFSASHLHGLLLSLVAQTGYKGHTTITFPLAHSRVVIRPPGGFLSSVTKVFTGTKRYEVVGSMWPFADMARDEQGRRCVVMSEEEWFDEWKNVIGRAVVQGKKGWVTVEDRLEWLMEGQGGIGRWPE